MNTELTTAAVERLTAQLGEALFKEPGLDLIEIANRCNRMAAKAGSGLLVADHLPSYTPTHMAASFRAGQNTERMQDKPEAVRLRDELRERAEFEAWADSGGFDITKFKGIYNALATRSAWEAWHYLAATGKQQVGEAVLYQVRQEIVREDSLGSSNGIVKERLNAWRDISKLHYEAYLSVIGGCGPTGVLGQPDGPVVLELNQYAPKTEVRALYAAPPAQAVDLARAIDIMWTWQEQLGGHVFDVRDVARTLTSPDMQAIGVDARVCIDATDRNQAIVLAKREILRALIDGQAVQP